jgi:glycosyltransferase involved in cell wall biosynthesis
MGNATRISLVLPCYNEIEHIDKSLAKIQNFLSYIYNDGEYEILLIDDMSTDGTRQWLKDLRRPNVRVHFNEKNLGRGRTVKEGLRLTKTDVVGFIDIDCEVAEYYLAQFCLSIEKGSDLATAQRIYKVAPQPYILFRHVLSSLYKMFLNNFVACPVKDTEAGYKFFSRRLADSILQESKFDGWFFDTECVLLALHWSCKIDEIPVAFVRNDQKTSTVKVFRDSFNYFKDIRRFLQIKKSAGYPAKIPAGPRNLRAFGKAE